MSTPNLDKTDCKIQVNQNKPVEKDVNKIPVDTEIFYYWMDRSAYLFEHWATDFITILELNQDQNEWNRYSPFH